MLTFDDCAVGHAWVKDVEDGVLEILLDVFHAVFCDKVLEQRIAASVVSVRVFLPSGEQTLCSAMAAVC